MYVDINTFKRLVMYIFIYRAVIHIYELPLSVELLNLKIVHLRQHLWLMLRGWRCNIVLRGGWNVMSGTGRW